MVSEIEALWLTLHSYFTWTIVFDTRLIPWNVSRSFWSWRPLPPLESKPKTKHNCIKFYILSTFRWYIVCGGFLENSARTNFLFGGHPRRFELKTLKWIDRVWRFDGFPWNLVRAFTDIDVEQNPVGEFLYVKYFPRGGLLRNRLREFFISRTWQIYKKITNRNKRKCRHGFGDLGFVINAAHLLYMNRILCPINSLEYQSVISELTALCHLWKAKSKTKHNCIEFYIL